MTDTKLSGPFVVAFNGPPRTGKDTAMNLMCDCIDRNLWSNAPVIQRPLAQPMREIAMKVLGLEYSFTNYELHKDRHHPAIGMTLRQLMIDLSEDFMIRKFGPEIWCKIWFNTIPKDFCGIIMVPDLGFQREIGFLNRVYSPNHVAVVVTDRGDFNFDNDSREYVTHSGPTYRLNNNGGLYNLEQQVHEVVYQLSNKWAI